MTTLLSENLCTVNVLNLILKSHHLGFISTGAINTCITNITKQSITRSDITEQAKVIITHLNTHKKKIQ